MRELEKARVLMLEETLRDERLLRKVMQESEWTWKRKETVTRLMAITRTQRFIECKIEDADMEVDDLAKDFFNDDEDEHIVLDSILADIGNTPIEEEEASD